MGGGIHCLQPAGVGRRGRLDPGRRGIALRADGKKTLRNLSLYLVAQGAQMAVPLATVPIFTRLINPEHYGVLDMLQIVMVIGIGMGNWGLLSAYERYFFAYADSEEKQRRLLGSVVGFSVLCFVAVFVALFALRHVLAVSLTGSEEWAWLLVIIMATGILSHLNSFFQTYFRNSEQAGPCIAYDLVGLGLSMGVSLVLVIAYQYGIWGLVVGGLAGRAVVFSLYLSRFGTTALRIDWAILKENLAYGWPLMTKVLSGVINITVDKFLVGTLVSLAALGVYGRAQAIAVAVFMMMTTVQNVYSPKWSRVLFGIDPGAAKALGMLFTDYVAIIIGPPLLFVLFSSEIVGVLLPEPYRPAIPLIIGLVVYYVILAFGKLVGTVGAFLKMTRFIGVLALVSNLVNIGLNIVLIPRYGAAGAVVVTCLVGLAFTALCMVVYGGRYRIQYEKVKLGVLYGGLLACAVLALVCYYGALTYWHGLALRIALGAIMTLLWVKVVGVKRLRQIITMLLQPLNSRPTVSADDMEG